jgi:protease-4
MKFARAIWKLLVGIKDALVLILLLLFFGALYAALSGRPEPVGEGVLAVDLDGTVVEQPSRADFAEVAAGGSRTKQYRLRDLIAALEEAREDGRVKAVALDLEGFLGGGQTAMAELSDALRAVRAAGKPVVAYSVGYTDDAYQIAAAASEVWLNPLGAVAIAGPGGSALFYKGLLDKLGVTANVYRVGTYKSAVEPFIRNDMSPEAKANYQALGQALLESWRETVLRARPKAKIDPYVRDMPAAVAAARGDLAQAALSAGLVDRIGDREAFEKRLAQLGGENDTTPGGYNRIKLAAYTAETVEEDAAGNIGVVTVAGMIVDGKAAEGTAGGDSIAEAIERGLRDGGLKALVVRVDSPGGSVLASERIRQALMAAKARGLPIVVSMGNLAASGGYWVATPANYVFAEPSTITGSIGVFGILPSFQGSLEKLGLGVDGVKTTPLSGEPDIFKGPSAEANQLIQAGVESTYRRFLTIVSQARRKSPQQIDAIGQGRVWDGGTARQLGLVDGFGGMEEAIAKAAQLAKLDADARSVRYLERPQSLRESLIEMLATDELEEDTTQDAFAAFAGHPQARLAAAVEELRAILSGPSIQAHCLECTMLAPTSSAAGAKPLSLLAAFKEWLF